MATEGRRGSVGRRFADFFSKDLTVCCRHYPGTSCHPLLNRELGAKFPFFRRGGFLHKCKLMQKDGVVLGDDRKCVFKRSCRGLPTLPRPFHGHPFCKKGNSYRDLLVGATPPPPFVSAGNSDREPLLTTKTP